MDSVWFVFLFLPAVILLNYITPTRFRSIIITLSSIVFLLLVDPYMLPLMLVFVFVDYLLGIFVEKSNQNLAKKLLVTLSILFNSAVFILSQYVTEFPVVLGVSVVSLVKISYIFDINSGKISAERNIFSYLSAVLCFPCLYYGPIQSLSSVSYMIRSGKETLANFGSGASLFIYGLFKKVIISDMLYTMLDKLYPSVNTTIGAWVWIIFSVLAFYYLLLGYSQMAQGLCKMLGFKVNQNFSFPFMAGSVTEFFRRFNIGLAEFVRKYVYIQFGGNRHGVVCLICSVSASCIVMSLWYGFSLNKVVAALFFAIIIVVEKTIFNNFKRLPFKILHCIFTYVYLFVGFTLFLTSSATEASTLLSTAFGLQNSALYDNGVLSCIFEYLPILIASVLMIFDFLKKINRAIQKKKSVFLNVLFVCFNLVVLFVCTAYIL